jgi:hypothetical protein
MRLIDSDDVRLVGYVGVGLVKVRNQSAGVVGGCAVLGPSDKNAIFRGDPEIEATVPVIEGDSLPRGILVIGTGIGGRGSQIGMGK